MLQHVLDAMRMVRERGFWMEIVTLVVPGFNDAPDDLRGMAETIAAISPDIPWHVTAFHQDYRMTDPRNTTAQDLVRVCEVGRDAGLRYMYAGNLPGRVGRWEHTWCPDCEELLIERFGIDPSRAVYIDDVPRNAAAARGLGIHGIHFTTPATLRA